VELRSQERAIQEYRKLIQEDLLFQEFNEFLKQFESFSRSRHLSDLVALFFLGHDKCFLEVGASYPEVASDTFALERYFGWSGIQIEPSPKEAELLRCHRKSIVIEAALVPSTQRESNVKLNPIWGTTGGFLGTAVKSVTWEEIAKRYGMSFDALFMDVEGNEFSLLDDKEFSDFGFNFLSIERIWKHESIKRLLETRGFINIWSEVSGYESWWISESLRQDR
jgi:hypothetical protein